MEVAGFHAARSGVDKLMGVNPAAFYACSSIFYDIDCNCSPKLLIQRLLAAKTLIMVLLPSQAFASSATVNSSSLHETTSRYTSNF